MSGLEVSGADAVPVGVAACQVKLVSPKESDFPLPLTSPLALSKEKVYSGRPSKATCAEPSGRLIVVSRPATALGAVGLSPDATVRGTQTAWQAWLLHKTLWVSWSLRYSVRPDEVASTLMPPASR